MTEGQGFRYDHSLLHLYLVGYFEQARRPLRNHSKEQKLHASAKGKLQLANDASRQPRIGSSTML